MGLRSITEVRAWLGEVTGPRLKARAQLLASDDREGVRAAVKSALRREVARQTELLRLRRLYSLEESLTRGTDLVVGVDEVGRGALAGPLTIGACVLPARPKIARIDDSKRLTPLVRAELAPIIHEVALATAVVHVDPSEIDSLGITDALRLGVRRALALLPLECTRVLMDGNPLHAVDNETAVVGGDRQVACIAAASIIAKVSRDALMVATAERYPPFGFDINKGYGTLEHIAAIREHGPCEIHRRSFAPMNETPSLF